MKKIAVSTALLLLTAWPGLAGGLNLAEYKVKITQPKDGITKEMKIVVLLAGVIGVGIENKAKEPIIVDWKLATFTNHFGHTSKVKVFQNEEPFITQDPTVVPPGERVLTTILSAANLKPSKFPGLPQIKEMYPKYWVEAQALVPPTPAAILLPIKIGEKQNFVQVKYTYAVIQGEQEDD